MPVSAIRRVVGIILFFAALAGLLVAVQIVPEWQVRRAGVRSAVNPEATKPSDLIALQNEMRKTVLQALGGAFAILALYLTYRRVKVSEEGQITDRYTKAIEQLGALTAKGEPNIEVRLGAIYALERIAQDSPRDHGTIMEVLTAYVRRNAPAPTEPATEEENKAAIKKGPRTEIQAILTVLGRRKRDCGREYDWLWLDLNRSDLRGTIFAGAPLERVRFIGAHMEGARSDYAHLEGAYFDIAHMEGAHFDDAYMEEATFTGAYLEGVSFDHADVKRASFVGANLEQALFIRSDLEGARFTDAHIEGAVFRQVVGLTVEQFRSARGLEKAEFDEAFQRELEAAKQKAVTAEEDRAPLETPSDETHPAEEDAG